MKVEKRYFKNWMYNRGILLNKLMDIVEANGGYLVTDEKFNSYGHIYEIHNRSVDEKIIDLNCHLEKCTAVGKKFDRYRSSLAKKIDDLKKERPKPYKSQITSYLSFILDETYYYLQLDDNPFMESYISKFSVKDMKVGYVHNLDELKKDDWFFDCLFDHNVNSDEFTEIANLIFNQIIKHHESEIAYQKKRIPNIYDSGWHYEKIPEKSNKTLTKIDRCKLQFA